ncbi:MAG: CocE/NonD family hydrolase [Clostridia bacterium]|nr:CocE/NonD family hydrolase [Clostridia bacterium]
MKLSKETNAFNYKAGYTYISFKQAELFTMYLLPNEKGKFPVVIIRTPYVDKYENWEEADVVISYMNEYKEWLKNGYAVVIQHCRGRGKSTGDCIPYINEREDGLNLHEWIRKQAFYNGELYFKGRSYYTSVHYLTAPFSDDVKGAIFSVQDTERYNMNYTNGFLKKEGRGSWYVRMYKAKSHMRKNYTKDTLDMLPVKDFTKTVFGESVKDFDDVLKAPNKDNEFWNTKLGGADTRNVTDNVAFPVLFTTGFYDIYTGGIFDMWNKMDDKSRKNSALLVSPYDHSDSYNKENSFAFENGKLIEHFGENYEIEWFNYIRKTSAKVPFELGKVTYYRLFENKWATDDFKPLSNTMKMKLGDTTASYIYNPYDAPRFKGGLSRNFGGTVYQDAPNSHYGIISVYTEPFEKETFVKGKMSAQLKVKSDCEDTCFYVRISITKEKGDLGLRDDITSLCYQLGDYEPNSEVDLMFNFDEHAFLIKKGERLRIDIASADNEHYVRHTNQKGLYSEQTSAKIAHNTVYLQNSYLTLPVEV